MILVPASFDIRCLDEIQALGVRLRLGALLRFELFDPALERAQARLDPRVSLEIAFV